MNKTLLLILTVALLVVITPFSIAIASDIADAIFFGTIRATNTSAVAPNVSVNLSINSDDWIDNGTLNAAANNTAIRNSTGADTEFMPGYDGNPWIVQFDTVPDNGNIDYTLYTNATGGKIRYFPDDDGMSVDDDSIGGLPEPGDNFTASISGRVDTDNGTGKNILNKEAAIKVFISSIVSENISATINPPYDLTTFTQVDASDKLTLTSSTVIIDGVDRDETIYAYKDFGAAYFDAIDLTFEIYAASTSQVNGWAAISFASLLDDYSGYGTSELSLYFFTGVARTVTLSRGEDTAVDSYVPALDTPYYIHIERAAGNDTVTAKIYTDAARTVLVDTLSVAGYGVTKWQYTYAFQSYNVPVANADYDGYIRNISYTGAGSPVSVTATGVTSGEHTALIIKQLPFFGIGIDTDNSTINPISSDLLLNAPLWQTETSSLDFTSIDANAYSCNTSGATWTSDGRVFDGVNDRIVLPTSIIPRDGTIEMWAKYNLATGHYLFSADLNEFSLFNNGGVSLTFYWDGLPGIAAVHDWATNEWFHLAVSYAHSEASYIYINGVQKGTATLTNATPTSVLARVGEGTNGSSDFTGTIGLFRIYDDNISPAQVLQNYNATKGKFEDGDVTSYSTLISVPDTSANWTIGGDATPYIETANITIGGVLQGSWEWEYGVTFTDLSGNSHDATPTFRTTSSDADVSASLITFKPISEAKVMDSISITWPVIMEDPPDEPSTAYSENITPGIFFAPFVHTIAEFGASNWSGATTNMLEQLFWYTFAFVIIIGVSISVFFFFAANKKEALFVKIFATTAVMVFFALPGINIYGLYVPLYYVLFASGILMLKKDFGW